MKSRLVKLKGVDGATISYNFFHKEQNNGKENVSRRAGGGGGGLLP